MQLMLISAVCCVELTLEGELSNHCLSFVLVYVHHCHLCPGLTQSVGKSSAYALPGTGYVGHFSIKTHPIKDGDSPNPTENFIICYFTLKQAR